MSAEVNFSTIQIDQLADIVNRTFLEEVSSTVEDDLLKAPFLKKEMLQANSGRFKILAESMVQDRYAKGTPELNKIDTMRVSIGFEKKIGLFDKRTAKHRISVEAWATGNRKKQIDQLLGTMTEVIPNRKNLDISLFLTKCDQVSYVDQDGKTQDISCADGLSINNANHLLRNSSKTYSTVVSGNPTFSATALTTAETSGVEESLDNLGNPITMDYDTIISTNDPALVKSIRLELESTASTSDNKSSGVINVNSQKYNYVILSNLGKDVNGNYDSTRRKMWGIVDSKQSDLTLLETSSKGFIVNDKLSTDDACLDYMGYEEYGVGIVTPRAFRISLGTNA